jgi:fucose permease
MNELNVEHVVADMNKRLPRAQQIHPDDPIVTSIILHNHILTIQVDTIQQKLNEAAHQIETISGAHCAKAATIADGLIARAGHCVEKQVDAAMQSAEERLHQKVFQSDQRIRRATWLAWINAILIFISACVTVGSYMGNFAFNLAHHAKERHR